jgi:hypothetical protein
MLVNLWKCWNAWETTFRQGKQPLRDVFDGLCRRADAREAELTGKAYKEGEADRNVARAQVRLDVAQEQAKEARAAMKKADGEVVEARRVLDQAERALKEGRAA